MLSIYNLTRSVIVQIEEDENNLRRPGSVNTLGSVILISRPLSAKYLWNLVDSISGKRKLIDLRDSGT